MNAIVQSGILQALGWAVFSSLYQMALLWVLFNLFQSFYRLSSSQKSKVATILLTTGFLWFTYTFFSSVTAKQRTDGLINLHILPVGANQFFNRLLVSLLPYTSITYLVLFLVPLVNFIRNYRYSLALRGNGLTKSNIEWKLFVKKVSARIGITKTIGVWISDRIHSPATIGYFKPVILIPLAVVNHLTPQQVEAVLLHELAHIRRHDYLVNLFVHFIYTILYFNPFVRFFIRSIDKEREKSCDQIVMQFNYDPHSYAEALLKFEKCHYQARSLAIAATGKNNLLQRIERIMAIEKKQVFSINRLAGIAAALLCILAFNAIITTAKLQYQGPNLTTAPFTLPLQFVDNESEVNAAPPTGPASQGPKSQLSKANTTPVVEDIVGQKNPLVKSTNIYVAYKAPKVMPVKNTIPGYSNVSNYSLVVPELNKRELKEIETTVEATKKIVAASKWKELEARIADALTTGQKEQLREKYLEKLNQVDWKKLELQLQLSFDQLNWDRINNNLNNAMISLKLDSLEKVYASAETNLAKAEEMLTITNDSLNQTILIPDVSVDQIRQSREQVIKNIEKIKAIRNKKIVHL